MRKSIFLLLTLLTTLTAFSKDECLPVSEAYWAKGRAPFGLTDEGYIILINPRTKNLFMVDDASYGRKVILAYKKEIGAGPDDQVEYVRSKSDKDIDFCFSELEYEDNSIVKMLESYTQPIRIKSKN